MLAIFQVRKLRHREEYLFLDLDWDPDFVARRGPDEADSPQTESVGKVFFLLIALGLNSFFEKCLALPQPQLLFAVKDQHLQRASAASGFCSRPFA